MPPGLLPPSPLPGGSAVGKRAIPAPPAPPPPDPPPPRRHQVFDLPPIELEITEYQRHARTCPDCGKRTWGTLPPGASRGILGPRLQAAAPLCTGPYRLSRPL